MEIIGKNERFIKNFILRKYNNVIDNILTKYYRNTTLHKNSILHKSTILWFDGIVDIMKNYVRNNKDVCHRSLSFKTK